jgi:hypothetical protein
MGYKSLFLHDDQYLVWWWKHLWKLKAPKKTRIFLQFALKDKVLTWKNIQKGVMKVQVFVFYVEGLKKIFIICQVTIHMFNKFGRRLQSSHLSQMFVKELQLKNAFKNV